MIQVADILEELCRIAPLDLQMSFDNVGLLLGRSRQPVQRVLLALDITPDVIEEAAAWKAELIISHHPLIFSGIKKVSDEKLLRLAEERIAVISMHTNLDIAAGGVNDVLLSLFDAQYREQLDEEGCGRIGELSAVLTLPELLQRCKNVLGCPGVRFYDCGKAIRRIAVMGGSGGDAVEIAAAKGCDCYLTADVKYHQFLLAQELGIHLIDAGHFCTENPIIPVLCQKLSHRFPEIRFAVSQRHKSIISYC